MQITFIQEIEEQENKAKEQGKCSYTEPNFI